MYVYYCAISIHYVLVLGIFKVIELLYKRFIDCYDFIFIVIGILLYFREKKIKKKITNN